MRTAARRLGRCNARNADRLRRRAAACVEQAFTWTKPAASSEIGVGNFEDLAASLSAFSATFEICRNDRSCSPRRSSQIADERGIP